ncbi:MAG: hypothetical protein WCH62_05060, partial [Candidatus Omnitrophota bacterium]
LILATWYKKKIKDSILAQVYAGKNKVIGLSSPNVLVGDPGTSELGSRLKHSGTTKSDVEAIYQRYLQAFKKGVYNYIKEEPDPITNQASPRKYFAGGLNINPNQAMTTVHEVDPASLPTDSLKIAVNVEPSERKVVTPNQILYKGQKYLLQNDTGSQGVVYLSWDGNTAIKVFNKIPGVKKEHLDELVRLVRVMRQERPEAVVNMHEVAEGLVSDAPGFPNEGILMDWVQGEEFNEQWFLDNYQVGKLLVLQAEELLSWIDAKTDGLSDQRRNIFTGQVEYNNFIVTSSTTMVIVDPINMDFLMGRMQRSRAEETVVKAVAVHKSSQDLAMVAQEYVGKFNESSRNVIRGNDGEVFTLQAQLYQPGHNWVRVFLKGKGVDNHVMSLMIYDEGVYISMALDFRKAGGRDLRRNGLSTALLKTFVDIAKEGTNIIEKIDDEPTRQLISEAFQREIPDNGPLNCLIGGEKLVVVDGHVAKQGEITVEQFISQTNMGKLRVRAGLGDLRFIYSGLAGTKGLRAFLKDQEQGDGPVFFRFEASKPRSSTTNPVMLNQVWKTTNIENHNPREFTYTVKMSGIKKLMRPNEHKDEYYFSASLVNQDYLETIYDRQIGVVLDFPEKNVLAVLKYMLYTLPTMQFKTLDGLKRFISNHLNNRQGEFADRQGNVLYDGVSQGPKSIKLSPGVIIQKLLSEVKPKGVYAKNNEVIIRNDENLKVRSAILMAKDGVPMQTTINSLIRDSEYEELLASIKGGLPVVIVGDKKAESLGSNLGGLQDAREAFMKAFPTAVEVDPINSPMRFVVKKVKTQKGGKNRTITDMAMFSQGVGSLALVGERLLGIENFNYWGDDGKRIFKSLIPKVWEIVNQYGVWNGVETIRPLKGLNDLGVAVFDGNPESIKGKKVFVIFGSRQEFTKAMELMGISNRPVNPKRSLWVAADRLGENISQHASGSLGALIVVRDGARVYLASVDAGEKGFSFYNSPDSDWIIKVKENGNFVQRQGSPGVGEALGLISSTNGIEIISHGKSIVYEPWNAVGVYDVKEFHGTVYNGPDKEKVGKFKGSAVIVELDGSEFSLAMVTNTSGQVTADQAMKSPQNLPKQLTLLNGLELETKKGKVIIHSQPYFIDGIYEFLIKDASDQKVGVFYLTIDSSNPLTIELSDITIDTAWQGQSIYSNLAKWFTTQFDTLKVLAVNNPRLLTGLAFSVIEQPLINSMVDKKMQEYLRTIGSLKALLLQSPTSTQLGYLKEFLYHYHSLSSSEINRYSLKSLSDLAGAQAPFGTAAQDAKFIIHRFDIKPDGKGFYTTSLTSSKNPTVDLVSLVKFNAEVKPRLNVTGVDKPLMARVDMLQPIHQSLSDILTNALDEQKQGLIDVRFFKEGSKVGISISNEGEIKYELLRDRLKAFAKDRKFFRTKVGGIKRVLAVDNGKEDQLFDLYLSGKWEEATDADIPKKDEDLLWVVGLSRGKESEKGELGGRGDGLYLAKRDIERAAGTIRVESTGGKVTFTVLFDAANQEKKSENEAMLSRQERFLQLKQFLENSTDAFLDTPSGRIPLRFSVEEQVGERIPIQVFPFSSDINSQAYRDGIAKYSDLKSLIITKQDLSFPLRGTIGQVLIRLDREKEEDVVWIVANQSSLGYRTIAMKDQLPYRGWIQQTHDLIKNFARENHLSARAITVDIARQLYRSLSEDNLRISYTDPYKKGWDVDEVETPRFLRGMFLAQRINVPSRIQVWNDTQANLAMIA